VTKRVTWVTNRVISKDSLTVRGLRAGASHFLRHSRKAGTILLVPDMYDNNRLVGLGAPHPDPLPTGEGESSTRARARHGSEVSAASARCPLSPGERARVRGILLPKVRCARLERLERVEIESG